MRNPLHSLCPYFAMFPEDFVRTQLDRFTRKGDLILDCFSGRGTTVLESLLNGRTAIGSDVNPVAFCISAAKAELPDVEDVEDRLEELALAYSRTPRRVLEPEYESLPPFFFRAFHHSTLRQLLFLRRVLQWRVGRTDRFIAACLLGSLHGELGKPMQYLSNQMTRTISTKPDYSLKYWKANGLYPPKRNVFSLLADRAEYRLSGSLPEFDGQVVLTDARKASRRLQSFVGKVKLAVTSPPYLRVTRYEEDQWLRLWALGYPPHPTYGQISKDDRHGAKEKYWMFLSAAWRGIAPLFKKDSVLVCRLGSKGLHQADMTRGLKKSIRSVFPNAELISTPVSSHLFNRQTEHFRPGSSGCLYEVDYVFALRPA